MTEKFTASLLFDRGINIIFNEEKQKGDNMKRKVWFVEFRLTDGRKVKVLYIDPSKKDEKIKRLYEDYPDAVEIDDGYFYE